MLLLGHLGVGSKIVNPWAAGLPRNWLWLGTVLPDLIDKALYYGLSWSTGQHGAALGLISSTRTFGHSALFLIAVAAIAAIRRSPAGAALAWGIASHLVLDNMFDTFHQPVVSSAFQALIFPLHGLAFSVAPFSGFREHLMDANRPELLIGEVVGAAILFWDYWQARHAPEIQAHFRERRIWLKLRGRGKRRGSAD